MQAAFILAGCLLLKAVYMVCVNFIARNRIKTRYLTFGDVIVASAMESGIQFHNECLLNAGDGHRHATTHKCHKHCVSKESDTGDSVGHCQKCCSFNHIDKTADLPHPSTAIKFKKPLLANLGSPALMQMIILVLCSVSRVITSSFLALFWAEQGRYWDYNCDEQRQKTFGSNICAMTRTEYINHLSGSWGGFNSSGVPGALPPNHWSARSQHSGSRTGRSFCTPFCTSC